MSDWRRPPSFQNWPDPLLSLAEQLDVLAAVIHGLERRLLAWHRQDQASQRLATIPGIGIITGTALAAAVTDPTLLRSDREFTAFLGLVPRQNSSGGKDRLGRLEAWRGVPAAGHGLTKIAAAQAAAPNCKGAKANSDDDLNAAAEQDNPCAVGALSSID